MRSERDMDAEENALEQFYIVLPSGGVPTLLPSPSIDRLLALGMIISALSSPLTQCGILTGSVEGNHRGGHPAFYRSFDMSTLKTRFGCSAHTHQDGHPIHPAS